MAILHGSWLQQSGGRYLFIWGETWRRIEPHECPQVPEVRPHPFSMALAELASFLQSQASSEPSQQHAERFNWKPPQALLDRLIEPRSPARSSRRKQETTTATAQGRLRSHTHILAIPTALTEAAAIPYHSATMQSLEAEQPCYLYPWEVTGYCLDPLEAMQFLGTLPLGAVGTEESFIGGDLRFWSHVARWSLDLLARSKFLPSLERQTDSLVMGRWQLLLDSAVDQARFEDFSGQMPATCRMYQGLIPPKTESQVAGLSASVSDPLQIELPPTPQQLLRTFLSDILDAQVRTVAKSHALSKSQLSKTAPVTDQEDALLRDWFNTLGSESAVLDVSPEMGDRLETTLREWTAPLQQQLTQQNLFRTCFYLHPPLLGQSHWTLEYWLQAADDPDFLVDAVTIWQHPVDRLVHRSRTIEHPQETLLMGLGLASRLYPPIEPSLQSQTPQSCSLSPPQAYEFLKSAAWRLQDSGFGVVLPPSLANREGWANRLGLKIRAEAPQLKQNIRLGMQSLLNFKWELSIGGQSLSKAEFDRLVALNTPLVEINGEWVELRPQDVRAAQNFFASRKDQTALSLEDALRMSTGDTQTIEKLPVVSFEASGALEELFTTLTAEQAVEAIPAPAHFQGQLRPYQSRGAGWLAFLERWGLGACLADDMGLGKTVELIAFLLHLQEQNALEQPTLLICPTSVLGNWEREVKRFGPTLKTLVHHGDKRAKGKAFSKAVKEKDLVITSYALLYRDEKELQSVSWQGIVLDEAQNIKNPEAKQSQAARQLPSQFRIALTGTPVENRLSELWSILDFLNPGYLGPRNFFQRRFAIPIEKYGDTSSLQTLRSLVQPFILRRLKTDREIIQDLPEKQEMTIFCGLSAEQASLYQHVVEQSLEEIESSNGMQRRGMILSLLVRLKQICNHPAQFLKESALDSQQRSGKLQRLEEMLEEALAEGDRALIFTQFAEWGKLLKPYLEQTLGREALFLYGSTSKNQREEMVDRFQHDPQGPRIMILSLKAGGVGLNLTRANHVFHFDRWWNPAVENQATDRVFRIGQTRNVQVHKFVCTGTLEEKIHEQIESKKALAEQVVGAGEQWLTELDTDQLRDLLILDRTAVISED